MSRQGLRLRVRIPGQERTWGHDRWRCPAGCQGPVGLLRRARWVASSSTASRSAPRSGQVRPWGGQAGSAAHDQRQRAAAG